MAYSEGTTYYSEFAGDYAIGWIDVDIDAATGDITIGEFDEVTVLSAELLGDPAANLAHVTAKENGSTKNQIDIKAWKSDFVTPASTFGVDVRICFVGRHT